MRRALFVLASLLIAVVGQAPPASFSLNTTRTFAPGEKASVVLQSANVSELEFRLYRVQDAASLYSRLPDAQSFGGQAPPVPQGQSFLERMHRWKYNLRYHVRRYFRGQFTDREREQLQAYWRGSRRASSSSVTGYAAVPLLNPQQLVRSWKVKVAVNPAQPWEGQLISFDTPGPGLYVLEATNGALRAATLANVTNTVIVTKSSPGRLLAHVVDRVTGTPLRDVALTLVTRGRRQEARTSSEGAAEFRPQLSRSDESVVLLALRNQDLAVATLSAWALQSRTEAIAQSYLYTDRPVYRPGHKVGWRAILRSEDAKGYRLPDAKTVDFELSNPQGDRVMRGELPMNEFGAVSAEWEIPKDAPLGYYSIRLSIGESHAYGNFQVEEYKKPEYEVKVRPAVARVLQGQPIEFQVDARYFFGEPVKYADVSWTVKRDRHWNWFWEDYDPEEAGGGEGETFFYGEQAGEGKSKLDAQGRAMIRIPTRRETKDDADYRIEVQVRDQAGRDVAGRSVALATIGSYWLNARPEKWVFAPNEQAAFVVEARDYDNQPRAGIPFQLTLDQQTVSGRTAADGTARVSVNAGAAGAHKGELRSVTQEGRTITASLFLWVSGAYRDMPADAPITLVPDKKSYAPGETARVLVVTGVSGAKVHLAVEGRDLYRQEIRDSGEGSFFLDVPIVPEHAPNVFVTASLLKDGKYRFGSKSLKVPPKERLLSVVVSPSRPAFKPGEPASYTITALDHLGRPAQGEFSLGVVDEALYGVAPDTTQAIDKAFYGRIWDRVQTETSLNFYFFGQAGQRPFPLAQRPAAATLAQLKPPRPTDPRVRKAFPDTALWLANVRTDAQGKAEARLQFPDSITAWRATARGITKDSRVGAATNRVVTRKDLILRLGTPRFATEGDEVVISAIVNNYLGAEKQARVTLEVEGAELLDGGSRQGAAAAGAETRFDFRVRARRSPLKMTAKALTDADSDALEITVPVIPFGIKRIESFAGSGTAERVVRFAETATARQIAIRTTPSLAGAILNGVEYLAHFPYGCTEQTVSSFVPAAMAERAIRELKLPAAQRPVDPMVRAGLERIWATQNPDGGWGWWEGTDSGEFMTAYVLAALRLGGVPANEAQAKARRWLRTQFDREPRAEPDFQAFVAYALAEPAVTAVVWQKRDRLSAYGLALLGLVSEGGQREELASRLEKLARRNGEEVHWASERDPLLNLDWDTSPEATAYALKFLLQARPKSDLLEPAVRWLISHRDQGHYWSSTKQTALVLYGLIDYLKATGELNPQLTATVRLNGNLVWMKELTQADALAATPSGFDIAPRQAENRVAIAGEGTGKLYWSIVGLSFDPRREAESRDGLRAERRYFRLLADGSRAPFDGTARVGETLISRVSVEGPRQRYLLLEDPIPAGAELLPAQEWGAWGVRREARDDRAALFETLLDRPTSYESRFKFSRPGKFRVNPARVGPMYQPRISASTGAMEVTVLP